MLLLTACVIFVVEFGSGGAALSAAESVWHVRYFEEILALVKVWALMKALPLS